MVILLMDLFNNSYRYMDRHRDIFLTIMLHIYMTLFFINIFLDNVKI